jgi:adiponectin receptor
MEGTLRRRLTVNEQIHEAAVTATANVPHRTRGKAKKLSHGLEVFDNLPDYLRDNEFIHGSYRKSMSMSSSFMTLFKIHNETGNVWTHLGGE